YADVVTQDPRNRYTLRLQQHFMACLKGLPYEPTTFEGPGFSNADRPAGIAGGRFPPRQQIVCYLFGHYAGAPPSAGLTGEVLRSTVSFGLFAPRSFLLVATHHFYHALTLAALYPRVTVAQQQTFRQTLGEELRRHRQWADNCPTNFENRYAL